MTDMTESELVYLKKLTEVKKIFTHASCADGSTSAMICKETYRIYGKGNMPEIYFIQYGQKMHDELIPEPNQLFVDITPPIARWEEWKNFDPIVLDHHETAKEVTIGLGGFYGEKTESGATLAFKHVFMPIYNHKHNETLGRGIGIPSKDSSHIRTSLNFKRGDVDRLSDLISTYDTWNKENPKKFEEAALLANAINFVPNKILLEQSVHNSINFLNILSVVLEKKKESTIFKYTESATFEEIEGLKVAFFNCTEKSISESANSLLDDRGADLAVGYSVGNQNGSQLFLISFRTNKRQEGLAQKLACINGGGGHPNAAGCRFLDSKNISHNSMVELIRNSLIKIKES